MSTGSDRQQAEQEHHRKAFELYYAQGEKRTYREVARQMGVSVSSVKAWAGAFGWRQRIRQRDATVARQTADRVLESHLNETEQNHRIVRMALIKVAKAINSGQARLQVADLDRLIRLETFLSGYNATKGFGDTPEEIQRRINAFFRSLPSETLRAIVALERAGKPALSAPDSPLEEVSIEED